jgi:membrane protein implicated in regulation of membrane protease activity
MFDMIVYQLGPWSWWVFGLVLLAAELLVPGVFLVWIGMAAIGTGVASLLLWETPWWVWQFQLLLFAVLAVVAILLGRRYFARDEESQEPLLNQRGESLVGRTAILKDPISEGRGRVKLDDTTWSVMGPDLPAGSRVKIVACHGRDLKVEAA